MKKLSDFLGPLSNRTEKIIISQPIIFTLLILYQGVFSGNAIKIPKKLQTLFENKLFKFVSVFTIAFTASQDIEYALISSLIFLTTLYLIKTPEERSESGFI
jgi:hypothetical protein